MLELKDLAKSYPHASGRVEVLRGVNARIERGEKVAVLGPSGSGKSTLLALLAGLDQPSSGTVTLDGQVLGALSERQLTTFRARRLGIVFQQFHLMGHLTALENVALPLRIAAVDNAKDAAAAALARVGLRHRLAHFPNELSGGECQRVAIARAMIAKPPMILADEPSGNLDAKTGHDVMKLLFDLVSSEGATLVLVTHNVGLAASCDRRLELSEGRLVEAHG